MQTLSIIPITVAGAAPRPACGSAPREGGEDRAVAWGMECPKARGDLAAALQALADEHLLDPMVGSTAGLRLVRADCVRLGKLLADLLIRLPAGDRALAARNVSLSAAEAGRLRLAPGDYAEVTLEGAPKRSQAAAALQALARFAERAGGTMRGIRGRASIRLLLPG